LVIGKPLTLKIGIHYGQVIAGIIGFHKPQFSLIGDTVNTTSRVCSTSVPNTVTVSADVYKLIQKYDEYIFKERIIEAKGKGNLVTYQIEKKRYFFEISKIFQTT
jgi:class 3 adenylate cyclase